MIWEGRPRTKQRPRLGKRRRAYTPAPTLQFEKSIREAWIAQHGSEPLKGPCGMTVEIGSNHIYVDVYEIEESLRPKYVTGDVDNYQKAIQDALNGVAYEDDKQVHYLDLRLTKANVSDYDQRSDDQQG